MNNPLKRPQKRENNPFLLPKGSEGRFSLHHVAALMTQVRPRKPVQDWTTPKKAE